MDFAFVYLFVVIRDNSWLILKIVFIFRFIKRRFIMPQKVVWDDIEWEPVTDEVSRKVIMGDNMMMVLYKFAKGTIWPMEQHKAEQCGYVVKGKIEFTTGGKTLILNPGDSYMIESMAPHESHYIEETVLVDLFSPPRKELMEKGRGFAPDRV